MTTPERTAEDDLESIASIRRELDDLRGTLLARVNRRPTGDIEPTLRKTPKIDTLFMDGATKNRADYPTLVQWAIDQGLMGMAGMFGNGDGTTTFVLPDFRGRSLVGAGFLDPYNYPLGLMFGFAKHTLLHDQMPSHSHLTQSTDHEHASSGGHSHLLGNHRYVGQNAHAHVNRPGTTSEGPDLGGVGADAWTAGVGHHTHGRSGMHNHGSTERSGAGQQFDLLQPSIAVNWMIWV